MKKVIRLTESELANLIKKIIEEQHQPNNFRAGQIVKAKRDKDGQIYTIKIILSEPKFMFGIIDGPGTYNGEPLKNTKLELYSDRPGEISGNMELGKFTVIR